MCLRDLPFCTRRTSEYSLQKSQLHIRSLHPPRLNCAGQALIPAEPFKVVDSTTRLAEDRIGSTSMGKRVMLTILPIAECPSTPPAQTFIAAEAHQQMPLTVGHSGLQSAANFHFDLSIPSTSPRLACLGIHPAPSLFPFLSRESPRGFNANCFRC